MRHITGIDLKNVVPFADVSVDIKKGLTYIRGINYDTDPSNPSSNGAGKSRLVSAIANVFFQAEPTSRRKNSKKEMLVSKQSSIGIIFKEGDDEPEHEILQMPGSYTVYKDGQDLELATIPKAEDYLRKLFPLTEREFYTRVFISTRREYPLQNATNADRLACFVECFHLDQYSLLQNHFSKIATSIKSLEVKSSVLEQQRIDLGRSLEGVDEKVTKAQAEEAAKVAEDAAKELRAIEKRRFALEQQKGVLENLLETERKLDALRKEYRYKLAPGEQAPVLKAARKTARLWEEYDFSNEAFKRESKKLQEKLDEITATGSVKDASKKFAELEEELSGLITKCAKLDDYEEERRDVATMLSDIRSKFKKLGVSPDPDYDYEQDIAQCKTALSLRKLLDEHSHEDGHVCPTCLSQIDFENIRKTVATAETQLKKFEKLEKAKQLMAEGSALAAKLAKYSDKSEELERTKAKLEKASAAVSKLEKQIDELREKEKLQARMAELESPKKPKADRPEESIRDLDKGLELCSAIENLLSAKQHAIKSAELTITVKSTKQLREHIEDLEGKISLADGEHRNVQKVAAKNSEISEQYRAASKAKKVFDKQLASIDADLAEMAPKIEEKKIVDALVKVYGAKGLRAHAASKIAEVFEANLNHYRHLIFFEPFVFAVKASETGLSITVDRNNGKPDSVSDVRNLSGAESNCYSLLCVISQVALVPDSLRTNLIVLDEPTSHMCEVTRSLFNNSYLPELMKMVPSVLVISPHSDDTSDEAYRWTIEKRNGVSTLTEG